ncbi:MAG: hypothetical protein PVI71_19215, partial [Desulfobacterales bacterium]
AGAVHHYNADAHQEKHGKQELNIIKNGLHVVLFFHHNFKKAIIFARKRAKFAKKTFSYTA